MWSQAALPFADLSVASTAIVFFTFAAQFLKEIGIPSPGVTQGALIYAGYQLACGDRFFAIAIVAAILLGCLCGSSLTYFTARALGFKLIEKYGKYLRVTLHSLEQAQARLRPAAFLPVIIGRLIPALMLPTSIASGVIRLPASRFFTGVGLSAVIWAGAFIGLGAVSGQIINTLPPLTDSVPQILGLVAGGVLISVLAYLFWKRRGKTQVQ